MNNYDKILYRKEFEKEVKDQGIKVAWKVISQYMSNLVIKQWVNNLHTQALQENTLLEHYSKINKYYDDKHKKVVTDSVYGEFGDKDE